MAVLLDNESELDPVRRIMEGRGDATLTKTVRDLLRERATELLTNGDPLAIKSQARQPRRRKSTLQPA